MSVHLWCLIAAAAIAAACTGGSKAPEAQAPAPKPAGQAPLPQAGFPQSSFPPSGQQPPASTLPPLPPAGLNPDNPNAQGPAPGVAPSTSPSGDLQPPTSPATTPVGPSPGPSPSVSPSPAPAPAAGPQANQPTSMGDWTNANADAGDGAPAVRIILYAQNGRFTPFVALSHKDQVTDFRFTYGETRVRQAGDRTSDGQLFVTSSDVSIPVKAEFNFKGRKCTVTIDAKPSESTKQPEC